MIRGGEENRQQVNVLITCKGWKIRNAAELHRKEKSGGEKRRRKRGGDKKECASSATC